MILRFLGTTPKSTHILSTLSSICEQIIHSYKLQGVLVPTDTSAIFKLFKELSHSGTETKPLAIVHDSLDQLSPTQYAHKLGWLPRERPQHCYIILSTLPDQNGNFDG